MLSLLFTAIATNLILTNEQSIIEETINSHERSHIKVVNKSYFDDGILHVDLSQTLESLSKTRFYDVQGSFELQDFLKLYTQSDFQQVFSGIYPIHFFEIDDQLLPNEMILTDYQIAYLIHHGILNDQVANQIGQVLTIKSHQFSIKDIYETDFSMMDIETLMLDVFFDGKKSIDFRTSKISSEGLETLFSVNYMSANVNNIETRFFSSDEMHAIPDAAIIGRKPVSIQEITIDIRQLTHITNQDTIELVDIPDFLDIFYNFTIDGITFSYKVVGVFLSSNDLYLYNETYQLLADELSYDFMQLHNYGYVFGIEDHAQIKLISREIADSDLFILTYYSRSLEAAIAYIDSMQSLHLYASIFAYLLLMLFIYYFTSHLVSSNYKHMGIFLSLGGRKKDLANIFIIENAKIFVYATIPTIILHMVLIHLVNQFIVNTWNFSIRVIGYKPIGFLITLMIALMIGYLTIWSSLKKIQKVEMLDVIYDRL